MDALERQRLHLIAALKDLGIAPVVAARTAIELPRAYKPLCIALELAFVPTLKRSVLVLGAFAVTPETLSFSTASERLLLVT